MFKNYLAIILALFFLSACQSTPKSTFDNRSFHITDVEVTLPADLKTANKLVRPTDSFHSYMINSYMNYAAEYNAMRPRATKGYKLKVDVSNVHFKNPVASLLIGDSNRLNATASVINPSTGQIVYSGPASYFDAASAALNGISGAVLSVVVKREAAEANMAKGSAENAMKRIFPDLKLGNGAKNRLKSKQAIQPRSTAVSSLSSPSQQQFVDAANAKPDVQQSAVQTSDAEVITLSQ